MIELDFSKIFNSTDFEDFAVDFFNCKFKNVKIYFTTLTGKDDKIDGYTGQTFADDKIHYKEIIQSKWFDAKTKPGLTDFKRKVKDTLVDKKGEYTYKKFKPQKVWFVFSESILQTEMNKLAKYIDDIFVKDLKLDKDEKPKYEVYCRIKLTTEISNAPERFKEVDRKYNMGIFQLNRDDLNHGFIRTIDEVKEVTEEENEIATLKRIFTGLPNSTMDNKIITYYNSHITFGHFYQKYLFRNFLEEERKKILKDISEDAWDNKVQQEGYHDTSYKYFEETTKMKLDIVEDIKDISVYRSKIKQGVFVNLSIKGRSKVFDRVSFEWEISDE